MLLFVCLMLCSYSWLVGGQDLPNYYASRGKNIFILAGQSNMAGRGGVTNDTWDGFIPRECRSNPLIYRLNAALAWEEAAEPLHRDIDINRTCGIGPGMAFANSVLQRDSSLRVIGLVPCAVGGTNISEWRRGSSLYNQLVRRTNAALQGGGGVIRALLWYQGESDTINREDAELYRTRLERFFTDLRADLHSHMLPIIQVALASGEGPYIDVIRKAQMEMDLSNVRYVDAKGLPLQMDGLHLSTLAQVQLGEMLADAFLQGVRLTITTSSAPTRFPNFFLDFPSRLFGR